MYLSVYLSIDLSIYLYLSLSRYLSVCLSVYLSIYLSGRSKTKKFCETSVMFEHKNVQNGTILRDVFIFLSLTTSETKQFCETSSFFEVQDIKNEEFCETSFKNGKLSAELTDSCDAFCDFPVHLSKVLRLPRKIDARSYEVMHLSRKISKPAHLILQNATPLRKSAP